MESHQYEKHHPEIKGCNPHGEVVPSINSINRTDDGYKYSPKGPCSYL
jgi:hypothetical protein